MNLGPDRPFRLYWPGRHPEGWSRVLMPWPLTHVPVMVVYLLVLIVGGKTS